MRQILDRAYPERHIAWIVKNHLRVSVTDDELYEHARQCVRNAFERVEDYTDRIIIPSYVRFKLPVPSNGRLYLPTAPINDLLFIHAIAHNGAASELGWTDCRSFRHSTLVTLDNLNSVDLSEMEYVEVEAQAGYLDKNEDLQYELPGAILQAVMLTAGTFFEYTSDTYSGSIAELPTSVKSLLQPYRISPYGEL